MKHVEVILKMLAFVGLGSRSMKKIGRGVLVNL